MLVNEVNEFLENVTIVIEGRSILCTIDGIWKFIVLDKDSSKTYFLNTVDLKLCGGAFF